MRMCANSAFSSFAAKNLPGLRHGRIAIVSSGTTRSSPKARMVRKEEREGERVRG